MKTRISIYRLGKTQEIVLRIYLGDGSWSESLFYLLYLKIWRHIKNFRKKAIGNNAGLISFDPCERKFELEVIG